MIPLGFHGCFGWLHWRQNSKDGDIAILLCPALNHDALNSHHAMRLLADQLAEAGYPTMRFDYPETGDSCDLDALAPDFGSELWAVWLNSIHKAADLLLRKTGAQKLVFCGLRIGATLAAVAAERRNDVVGLIFLAPVLKGQSYLRQIWIESRLQNQITPPMQDGIRFQELNFSPETVKAIGSVDLRRMAVPKLANIAIFSQTKTALLEECCQAWEMSGAKLFRSNFQGLEPMLILNIEDEKAHPRFDSILTWLKNQLPPGPRLAASDVAAEPLLHTWQNFVETPFWFGAESQLFGVLSEPKFSSSGQIILIVNAGRDPRHGPGRLNVEFARLLAKAGIAALRLDFAGLGDSLGPAGSEAMLSPAFDLDRVADISAAIDALEKIGYRHFSVYGLCSGAYHAMQAAVMETRIERLLLVNIPLFKWSKGQREVDFIRHKNKPLRYFLRELIRLRSWGSARHKLAKSGSVLRGQLEQLSIKIRTASWIPKKLRGRIVGELLTPGQRNMQILARRGVKTLFLFGEGDLGLDAVYQEFGGTVSGLAQQAGVTMHVLPDFDHLVAHESTRRAAGQSMMRFLADICRAEASPVTAIEIS